MLTDTLNLSNKSSTSYHEMTNLSEQHCKFDKSDIHKLSTEEPKAPIVKNETPPSSNGRFIVLNIKRKRVLYNIYIYIRQRYFY